MENTNTPFSRIISDIQDAWRVVRAALGNTWSDLLTTALVSLMWLGLSLPLATAPAAALALFYVGNRLAHGDPTDPRDFWQAFRRYFFKSWRWGILQLAVLFFLIGDILLVGRQYGASSTGQLVQGFYLALLAGWLLLQIYTLAFVFEQEEFNFRLALRNGIVMMGHNPFFSITLGTILLVLLAAGIVCFFITSAAGGVLVATVGSHAVLNRLQIQATSSKAAVSSS